ncbi:VOC family protein [Phenylobacterium sp.]|uniref:VOC family protein n=1 Tax=Phenylobacterium sp. TaxID=1871053 RepID=UPI0025E8ECBA|nr:VOC family protein [Phenylobacterium sp.]
MDRPTFVPAVFYKDPIAALKFLEAAFGFEVSALVTDADGNLAHSEVTFRGGALNVGGQWEGAIIGAARMRSPAAVEGVNTQFLRINLDDGLDAHCERARAAGAVITAEPEDQFYGARTYRALDPEGHVWNFNQEVAAYDAAGVEKALGFKTATSLKEAGLG